MENDIYDCIVMRNSLAINDFAWFSFKPSTVFGVTAHPLLLPMFRKALIYKENPITSTVTGFTFLWSRVRESNPRDKR